LGLEVPEEMRDALALLPELLGGGARLPNGVVELVLEDAHAPVRHLFDVHDGVIVALEPGSAVPWASVSGAEGAWRSALGPDGDTSQLRHTGEPLLGERLLAELRRRRLRLAEDRRKCSVLDCS
jgi:hypothetical protein